MQNKIRIGIVTTPEVINLFDDVLKEINIEVKMLVYHHEQDLKEIILKNQAQLDVFLFSGPVAYYKSLSFINKNIPSSTVGYNQVELSKGLLLLMKDRVSFSHMSIDTFSQQMVNEMFQEINTPLENIFVKEFNPNEDHSQIIKFHLDLWQAKKIDFVITARRRVYLDLKEKGISILRVFPSKFSIRESLNKALLLGENSKNLDSQIAVCIFSLILPERLAKGSNYKLEKLRLDYHKMLVDFAHKIDASIVPSDSFEFILYTNRGYLNEVTSFLNAHFIEQFEKELSSKVCIGLGFGITALSAQNHAKLAIQHAKMQGGGCGYLVRDDGKIVGPIKNDDAISYVYKSEEPLLNEIALETHLSIDTVSKIIAFSQKYDQFAAEDLANTLHVSQRYGRNIINALVKADYLQQTGKERPYPRGRPRNLYSFIKISQKTNKI